jgi:6-phosphogluconolactonase
MYVYVGSYTAPSTAAPAGGGDAAGSPAGIDVFEMDAASGALTPIGAPTATDNPSFLVRHPQRPLLFAANETPVGRAPGPGISAFAVDPGTGALTAINRRPALGTSPCYVSVDPQGRYVLLANYGDGTLVVFPILPDGSLGEATDRVQHVGFGPDQRRQQGPHAHSVRFDPAGDFVLACDLGIDRVLVYRLDPERGTLRPHDPPSVATPPGGGPRHLSFHPSGRFAYVNNEITSALSVFAYDPARGVLQELQTISTLPAGADVHNSTAQVMVHPSGRFVYVSNRGHDSIALFAVDNASGTVTAIGHQPTLGKTPRNFNIVPAGDLLYAANQGSGTVVAFRVDPASGGLTPIGQVATAPAPVCIVFADR